MQVSTVTSLAILKANWDNLNRDYIQNFVPLVAECIRLMPEEVISTPEIKNQLQSSFGLNLPHHVIDSVLRRVSRDKYIYRDHGVYRKNRDLLETLNFKDTRLEIIERHDHLINHFIAFCKQTHNIELDIELAESAIQAYIDDNQINIIDAKSKNSIIPHVDYPQQSSRFLVASFVKYIQENQLPSFEYFETVVKGNMLANAVFLPNYNHTPKKFQQTQVYLDTSFILFAIGHAGEARQGPCLELIQLLKDFEANIFCFTHTLDECRGILNASAQIIANNQIKDAYGPSVSFFLSKGYKSSDIVLFTEKLDEDIRNLGIRVVDKPDYTQQEYMIDEAELEKILNDAKTRNGRSAKQEVYRNRVALRRDVDSIAAIMRIRRNALPIYYENCYAIFITTNTWLTSVSQNLFYKDTASNVVPACQTDFALTNILWLKQPNQAPNLPRKRIIADYYASMQPTDKLWKCYITEIEKQQAENRLVESDYYILRYMLESKQALMDVTLGDEDAFTQGSVQEILEVARLKIAVEAEENRISQLEAKQQEIEQAQLLIQSQNKRLQEIQNFEEDKFQKRKHLSSVIARTASRALLISAVVFFAFTTYLTSPIGEWNYKYTDSSIYNGIIFFSILVLLLFSVLNIIFGTRVMDLTKYVESRLCYYLEIFFQKL